MKELHALVDFENVQPTLEELAKPAPGFTDLWLFHGPHQAKQAQQLAAAHSGVTLVPRSGKGPNALDFHLTFYLGYVAARHPHAHLVVVANDKGYDPMMIAHAKELLGFTVKRVGHKAKPPVAVKTVAKKAAPVAKAAPAKKSASAKAPAPMRKTPAKKVLAKKAVAAKAPAPKAAAKAVAAVPSESKEFTRVKKALAKMGAERPTKLKSFLRHVKAMLGKDSTAEQIDAVVQKLEQAKVVRVAGDMVSYGQG